MRPPAPRSLRYTEVSAAWPSAGVVPDGSPAPTWDTGAVSYPFLKGHGTENDFVLLPDHDGSVHGDLPAQRVRALCDRRAGIGGDGFLRVIRTQDASQLIARSSSVEPVETTGAEWFM